MQVSPVATTLHLLRISSTTYCYLVGHHLKANGTYQAYICRTTPPPKTWLIFLFSLFKISRDEKAIIALLDRVHCSAQGLLLAAFASGVFHSFVSRSHQSLYSGREST